MCHWTRALDLLFGLEAVQLPRLMELLMRPLLYTHTLSAHRPL